MTESAPIPPAEHLKRCEQCGSEFETNKYARRRRFCSHKCSDRAFWARKRYQDLSVQLTLPHPDFCRPSSDQVLELAAAARIEKEAALRAKALHDAAECAEMSAREPVLPQELRIRHLAEAMIRDYKINGLKSLRTLLGRWHRHLEPCFGDLLVFDVPKNLAVESPELRFLATFEDRIAYYIARRQEEKAKNSSINRELVALKRMFSLAVQRGRISAAPYIPHLRERNVRKGFVEDADYRRLAEVISSTSLWFQAFFELGYTYGWRKSELLKLRVRQVDIAKRTIRLDPGTTKNEEGRTVVMTDRVLNLLRKCVAGKQPEEHVLTRDRDRRGRRARCGGVITDYRNDWAEAVKRAGLPGLIFHDLRRTAVRNMVRGGIPERVAMQISGHLTRSIFDRYNIVSEADLREAARKLNVAAKKRSRQRTPTYVL